MAHQKTKICISCNQLFRGRQDARTCSERCRKRFQRAKLLFEQEASSLKNTAENIISRAEQTITPFATEEGFVGGSAGVATTATPAFSPVTPATAPSTPAPAATPYVPPTPVSQPIVPALTPQASASPISTTTPLNPVLQAEPLATPSHRVAPSSLEVSAQPSSNSLPTSIASQIALSPAPLPETPTAQTQFRSGSLEFSPSSVFPVSSPAPSPGTPNYPVSQPQVITPANSFETPAFTPPVTPNPTQSASSILPSQATEVSKTSKSMPRLPGFSFPSWARMAIASTVVVSMVAIGTYLLGNQNAQTKANSQTATAVAAAGKDVLPSGGNVQSVHFNKAVTIDQGAGFTATGTVSFKNLTNSSSALNVQDAVGDNVLVVDTLNKRVGINTTPIGTQALQVGGDVNITGNYLINGVPLPSSSSTLSDTARLSANQTFISNNTFLSANNLFNGNGAGLTSLNAANIASGTISDGRLSNNVALLDGTGPQTFSGNNKFQSATNSVGVFQIQNSAGTSNLFVADNISTRIGIGTATPAYTLDVAGDINSTTGVRVNGALLCNASGCTAAGGSGSYVQNGTALQTANFNIQSAATNTITATIRATTGQTADLLQIKDQAAVNILSVGPTGNVLIQPSTNSVNAFAVYNANATSHLIGADTLNARVAIAKPTPPDYTLDVGGDINTTTGLRVAGNLVCSTTCTPGGGSGSYVQNGTTLQTANFAIQSDLNTHVVGLLRGASGQSAALLQALSGDSGSVVLSVGATGDTTIKSAATFDSTTAFRIQNAAGNNYIQVDTLGANLYLGNTGIASSIQVGNTTGAVVQTINIGNNATASSVTNIALGSGIGASRTDIYSGTNGLFVGADSLTKTIGIGGSNSTVQFQGTSGSFAVDGTTITMNSLTGKTIGLGINGIANTIQIGNTTGAVAQTINIGNNATASSTNTVVLGSTIGSSATTIQAGTGNLNLTVAGTSNTGIIAKTTTNSTAAFQVQPSASSTPVLNVDTTNKRVGVGLAAPLAPFHVLNGTVGATFTPVTDETIVLQRNQNINDNAVLTLVSGSVGTSIIRLTNAGATEAGKIGYDSSVNAMYFYTNGGEKLRVASTGALTVAGGQAKDIATASAGTSNAITIQPGDSTTNSGTGSDLTLKGSNNTGTTSTGGNVVIQAGTGTSTNGQVQIAASGLANIVQIGNTTGAVAQTINIGNNATASSATTLTVGSTIGTSPVTLQAGTTGITAKTTSTTAFVVQKADGTGTILTANTSAGTITVGGLLTVSSSGIAFSDGTTQTSAAAKSKVVNVAGDEQMLFYWDSTLNEWVTPRFTLIQIAPDPAQNFGVAFQSVNAEHTVQAGVVAVSAKYAAGMKLDLRWEGYAWVDQQHTTLGRLYGYQSNNNQNPLANFPTALGSGKLYNDISIYPGNQGGGGTEANFDTGWLGGITATSTVQNTLLVKAAAIDNAGTENIRVGGNVYARWVMP